MGRLKVRDINCSVYCVQKVLYTDCQSWPWPLTPWPKINRVPPLIMGNVHVKFESDWAKTVVAIVPTRFYVQSVKVDLDLWLRDTKSIRFLLSSWRMCMWSLKVIGQNCSRYRAHKVLYTECQSWPWPLTQWPKINRVPPLIMANVHVNVESDWAKNCSCYHAHKVLCTECQSWPWPLTAGPKINRVPPLIMANEHVKFESDWAKL